MYEGYVLKIDIGGQEYGITTKITFNDINVIHESLNSDEVNYKEVFAKMIQDKVISEIKPNLNDIYLNDDLKEIAKKFVLLRYKIKDSIEFNCDEMIFYKSILNLIHDKSMNELKELTLEIPQLNSEILQNITNALNTFQQTISNIMSSEIVANFKKTTNQISQIFNDVSLNIANLFKDIKIPTISEERKEELRLSYKNWGCYGWTMLPELPISGYGDCPSNIVDANKLALSYMTKEDMNHLFNEIRGMKGVKKSDLEEAIFAFEHKKYKSCALILFGLIDAKLIRLQRINKNTNNRREVGKKAAELVLEKIKNEHELEKKFLLLLDYENIFACLSTVFANGKDFRKQPNVINRNFLDHGMMTKNVIRKDCVQLFLLYYNLLMFLEFMK